MAGSGSRTVIPWRERAACQGKPVDLFFDGHNYGDGLRICARCEVVTECRAWTDRIECNEGFLYGIFGGETPDGRKARRTRNRSPVRAQAV